MLVSKSALLGESAETCMGEWSFSGETQEREYGCNKLERAQAAGLLFTELLQVRKNLYFLDPACRFFNFAFENTVKAYRATKNGLQLLKRKCNIFHNTAINSKTMPVVLAALLCSFKRLVSSA